MLALQANCMAILNNIFPQTMKAKEKKEAKKEAKNKLPQILQCLTNLDFQHRENLNETRERNHMFQEDLRSQLVEENSKTSPPPKTASTDSLPQTESSKPTDKVHDLNKKHH